ncbi:unnamed protein product [Pleuronectes platessa]|uniref:Uncharacterized protein n=1 Tax=Pleuronectes platessa TaxID=8262 RepID=A0A9N7YPK4_PLEPL|nr:unnamed protein product [Pleuronectes platessa]
MSLKSLEDTSPAANELSWSVTSPVGVAPAQSCHMTPPERPGLPRIPGCIALQWRTIVELANMAAADVSSETLPPPPPPPPPSSSLKLYKYSPPPPPPAPPPPPPPPPPGVKVLMRLLIEGSLPLSGGGVTDIAPVLLFNRTRRHVEVLTCSMSGGRENPREPECLVSEEKPGGACQLDVSAGVWTWSLFQVVALQPGVTWQTCVVHVRRPNASICLRVDLVYQDLVYEDLVYQDLVYQDSIYQDLVYQDLVYEDLVYQDLVYEDLVYQDLVYEDLDLVYQVLVYRDLLPLSEGPSAGPLNQLPDTHDSQPRRWFTHNTSLKLVVGPRGTQAGVRPIYTGSSNPRVDAGGYFESGLHRRPS